MSAELAESIRAVIGDDPNIGEVRMFGALCFMLNGNMLVGTMKDGSLLVRVGEAGMAHALSRPGAARMTMGERTMGGFVVVDAEVLDESSLRAWIATATDFVGPMPVKTAKPKTPPKRKSSPR